MTTVTFDTLEAVAKLKAVGISQEHADAFIRAIADAQNELATKRDIDAKLIQLEQRLTIKLGSMMVVAVGLVAVLVKLF